MKDIFMTQFKNLSRAENPTTHPESFLVQYHGDVLDFPETTAVHYFLRSIMGLLYIKVIMSGITNTVLHIQTAHNLSTTL